MRKGMVNVFDFGQERFKSSCPSCQKTAADVNGLILWNCKFVIEGVKVGKEVQRTEIASMENYTLFEPTSLMKEWSYLIITTNPLDEAGNGL
jgi:hypothetical protein